MRTYRCVTEQAFRDSVEREQILLPCKTNNSLNIDDFVTFIPLDDYRQTTNRREVIRYVKELRKPLPGSEVYHLLKEKGAFERETLIGMEDDEKYVIAVLEKPSLRRVP